MTDIYSSTLQSLKGRAVVIVGCAFLAVAVCTVLKIRVFPDEHTLTPTLLIFSTANEVVKGLAEVTAATFLIFLLFDANLRRAEELSDIVRVLERIRTSQGGPDLLESLGKDLDQISISADWARFTISVAAKDGGVREPGYTVDITLEEQLRLLKQPEGPLADSMESYSGDDEPWHLESLTLDYQDGTQVFDCITANLESPERVEGKVSYEIKKLKKGSAFIRKSVRRKVFYGGIMDNHIFKSPTAQVLIRVKFDKTAYAPNPGFPLNIFAAPSFEAAGNRKANAIVPKLNNGFLEYDIQILRHFLPSQGFSFYRTEPEPELRKVIAAG